MILAVDIGNTAIKLAVVDDVSVYDLVRTTPSHFIAQVQSFISNYPNLSQACVCQVGHIDIKLLQGLESLCNVYYIDQHSRLPFTNKYTAPTLGNDRKALVAGALCTTKDSPKLIIDAGTCVTYDFIDGDHNYWGGGISPGLRLRFESLHNFTANLPLLTAQQPVGLIGDSTTNSILSGVVNGLTQEIKGTIRLYKKQYKDLDVLITGGDADLLIKQMKNRFFASPFLMLFGIYNIYKINS